MSDVDDRRTKVVGNIVNLGRSCLSLVVADIDGDVRGHFPINSDA